MGLITLNIQLDMENIIIRKVTVNDIGALQEISRQTFEETSSESTGMENMRMYLNEEFSIEKLTSEYNNFGSWFYFVLAEEKVIGYIKLNEGETESELKFRHGLEIQRIYVLKAYHGKKIGQLLCDHAIKVANDLKCLFVWLCVWEENLRAMRFYQKNGFVEFDRKTFKLGKELQNDIVMKKNLD